MIISATTLLGLTLRLLFLKGKPFWFDEAISWALAKQKIAPLLTATLHDNHPPLYYLLLHFWMRLGQSELFLRLPSIIFGTFSIFLIYLIGKKLFNKKVAVFSSLLFALSPLHIYFSTEIRMYSLWTMLTLATFYFFLIILKKPTRLAYLFFTLCSLLSLYTHYFTIPFLLILDCFLVLKRKKYKKQSITLLLVQIGIGLLFLPWLLLFLSHPHPRPWGISPLIGLPATFLSFVLGGLGQVNLKTFFAAAVPFPIKAVFILSAVLFGFLFIFGIKDRKKPLLLLLVFLPILTTALISLFYPIYSPRLFLVFSPYFYILTAKGIENLDKKLCFWTKILSLTLLLSVFLVQNFYPPFKPQTLKEAVVFIKKSSPTPPIIVHTSILTFYPFTYYFQEQASQFLVFPSDLTKKTTDIIGGSPVSLSEVTKKDKPFLSVHLTWDGKTWQFKEKQPQLKEDFEYHLVKTINDLEIFYYQK